MTHQKPVTAPPKPSLAFQNVLYGVIILLVVGCGYLIFRNRQLKDQFTEEQSELHIRAQANKAITDQQQLLFGMKTFTWAVRNALLQNKAGEVNEYFNTLVQNKGVQEMLLVDSSGKVTLSTNKKNQGVVFASRFPAYLLQKGEIYFHNGAIYELSAPVTAPNKRLGTLVMFYKPTPVLPAPTE